MLKILTVLLCAALCNAATYYVATTGNDTTGTGAVGAPWATIQKALDTVATGNDISVSAGNYPEATNTYIAIDDTQIGKTLTVTGTGVVRVTSTAANFAVYVAAAATSGDITFNNILFTSDSVINTKTQIDQRGACALRFNSCTFGGTNGPSGYISTSTLSPVASFNNCTFLTSVINNISFSSGAQGATTITNCTFASSSVASKYSVANVAGVLASLTATGNTFTLANTNGYGIYNSTGAGSIAVLDVRNNTFTCTGGGTGSILCPGQTDKWRIIGNTVTLNNATDPGVGLSIGTDGATASETLGPGECSDNTLTYTNVKGQHGLLIGAGVDACTISGNRIIYTHAAPEYTNSCIAIVVKGDGNKFFNNSTYGGRGLLLKSAKNNLVQHNTFVATYGNCVEWYTQSAVTASDNIIRDNIITGTVPLINDYDGTDNGVNWNNLLENNVYYTTNANFGRLGATTYTTFATFSAAYDIYTPWSYASIGINSDPKLKSDNYTLMYSSPAWGLASDGTCIGAWQPDIVQLRNNGLYMDLRP